MKIGILTYYNVHNYGAMLQMYALNKILTSLGNEVEVIQFQRNYLNCEEESKKKYQIGVRSIPYYLKKIRIWGIKRVIFNVKKYYTLNKFRKRYINLGREYSDYREGELDLVIIGSDEVFAIDVGFNPFFYGIDVKANKIVTYAGSFGKTNLENIRNIDIDDKRRMMEGFEKKIDVITVRDLNSRHIVHELTGRDVSIVCDPVLLYGYEIEINQCGMLENEGSFLLIYSYDNNLNKEDEYKKIKDYAKANDYKTISVGYYHFWCDKNIVSNPIELLAYFKNAKKVFTDTFHGAVLSIITRSQFTVLYRDNRNKLEYLLNSLNLEKRGSEDVGKAISNLSVFLEYARTEVLLNGSKKMSGKALKEMLRSV